MKSCFSKLTLVTNKSDYAFQDYLNFISECAHSGISAVQLREKKLKPNLLLQFGNRLHELLMPLNIPLIVNDSLELCLALNAEGLHLGQTDGDVCLARRTLGDNKIIGLSVNTLEQLEHANTLPVDYIGVGAIFPTLNKPNIQNMWSLESLRAAVKASCHPIIAIGGINETNAQLVMKTGVYGIAAIDAFHRAQLPADTTKNLLKIVCSERLS